MRLWAPDKRKGMALLKPVFAVFVLISLVILRSSPLRIYVRGRREGVRESKFHQIPTLDLITHSNTAQTEDAPRGVQHRVGPISPVESTYTVGCRPSPAGSRHQIWDHCCALKSIWR